MEIAVRRSRKSWPTSGGIMPFLSPRLMLRSIGGSNLASLSEINGVARKFFLTR